MESLRQRDRTLHLIIQTEIPRRDLFHIMVSAPQYEPVHKKIQVLSGKSTHATGS